MMRRRCFTSACLGAALMMAACRSDKERCSKCGMVVDDAPRWIAGVTNGAGKQQRFCSPACMLVWLRSPAGTAAKDPWVTEYYSQQRSAAADVRFVTGSDVIGPMGKSFVPVADVASAERFKREHDGKGIFTFEQLTAQKLKALKKSGGVP